MRAAAAAEARQVREKARRMGQMRRAPKDVVMSEAQRRMVQSILREQGHDIDSPAPTSAAFQTDEGGSVVKYIFICVGHPKASKCIHPSTGAILSMRRCKSCTCFQG